MFVRILFSVSMILSTETKIHSASTEVTLVAGSMVGVSVFCPSFCRLLRGFVSLFVLPSLFALETWCQHVKSLGA
jgi:hypothetical protein